MTVLAIQMNRNRTKLILYSAYALLLSLMAAPPRFILYQDSNLAMAVQNVQYGYISREIYSQNKVEEIYKNRYIEDEQKRWDESVKSRYKNGSIYIVKPGVKHIRLTKHTRAGNIKINVVEINKKINSKLEVAPVLASSTLNRKATIKNLATKSKAIAAVNATYFKPQSGVPLGVLMIDKKVYTGPIYNRVALGIGKDNYVMEKYEFDAKLKYKKLNVKIDNINQPRMLSTYVLAYTSDWGEKSPVAPKYGVNIAISEGKIQTISVDSLKIPEKGFVVSGPKSKLTHIYEEQMSGEKQVFLANLFGVRKIELEIQNKAPWEKMNHIVSGGPFLVKDGNIFVDVKEQKLLSITGRNPRTAVGYTKNNEFIMMTVDGREKNSIGMTLEETAQVMKDFGCIWAMNLDGGGSSVMYVKDRVVNNPNVIGGIAISNALVIRET